jgi:CheY-like chemotaxis protein
MIHPTMHTTTSVKNYPQPSLLAPGFAVRTSPAIRALILTAANTAPSSRPSCSGDRRGETSSASRPAAGIASIYVVDDEEGLTDLYTIVLQATGYRVRAFNHRAEALAALTAEERKPDLLVTDYCGASMPIDQFMERCLAVHPALRILMASGLSQADVHFFHTRPDRFIQKPFTPEGFLREVRATLAAR